MRRAALGLLLALAAPGAARAQTPLVVGTGAAATTTAAALHRGYAAYPATALRAFGMDVRSGPEGAQIVAWRDTIVVHALAPFFTAGDELYQLAHPAYAEGGVVYLPRQFFIEWLPAHYGDSIALTGGALVLRRAAPAPAPATLAPATPARDTVAAQPLGMPAPPPRPAATAHDLARVVVIDAGHGGRDAGAQGPGGIREKDVTLGIALRLAALLRSRPGYEVHLTRSTDTLIALFDRPRLANDWKDGRAAALFVSIHANSHRDAAAAGFETFILSEARTADERAVAERENAAASYDHRDGAPQDEMSFILSDLRNEFYVHASHDLATLAQSQIDPLHPGLNRGVKQAAFVVLVGAYMPAVLVETAFISNPAEARMLASSTFQDQMAMALSRAVHEFFETHAYLSPEGDE